MANCPSTFVAASRLRGHAGPLRCVWPFAQKRDARSPAACVTACAEIQKVISSFEFENSILSTRICNEFRFFDPRLTSLVSTNRQARFLLVIRQLLVTFSKLLACKYYSLTVGVGDAVFHQVGLYMKIEPVLDSAGVMVNVSKTLLCNDHKPANARPFQPMIDNSIDNDGRPPAPPKDKSRPRGRRRKDRKNGSAVDDIDQSACNVPVIPPER